MRGPILVFGATGTHGGAVARAMIAAGGSVEAFVRNPHSERALALESEGVRLVAGNLDDAPSVTRALAGVDVAYAVTTPFESGPDEEVRQGEQIVGAAVSTQLPWLIFASVASAATAAVPHFRSKARIEERLRDSPLAWTVVAPSYFYENVLGSADAISEGHLPLALPANTPLQQVALEDLGALVVAIISRSQEHIGERVEVAADSPTPDEMARALGVTYEETPLVEVAERNPDLAAMYAFLASDGYSVDIEGVKRRYPEVAWKGFAEWAAGENRPSSQTAAS